MSFENLQGKLVQKGLEVEAEWSIAPASGFSPNRAMTSAEVEIFNQSMRRWAAEYARIMSPLKETPAARALANVALLEALERQMLPMNSEHWKQSGDLAKAKTDHPALHGEHFVGEPKCNLFLEEAFYETKKFAAPKHIPSANAIASLAKTLLERGIWKDNSQPRWFDIVKINEAQFGDILVIDSKNRTDITGTKHGHVEYVQEMVRNEQGLLTDIVTIGASGLDGARQRGMKAMVNRPPRTTFGRYNEQGVFELHAATKIIRARLSR